MRYFQRIAAGVDVTALNTALYRQPELWDRHTERTDYAASPHHGVSDVFLRFRDQSELTEPKHYAEPHIPVFYPAWHALPPLRPLVFGLMAQLQAVQLGAMLITRIPPGCQVLPHDDRGRWSPEFFNVKAYVVLDGNADCVNTCGDDAVVMQTGDVWLFDNLVTHSVTNAGTTDRLSLIVTMRVE